MGSTVVGCVVGVCPSSGGVRIVGGGSGGSGSPYEYAASVIGATGVGRSAPVAAEAGPAVCRACRGSAGRAARAAVRAGVRASEGPGQPVKDRRDRGGASELPGFGCRAATVAAPPPSAGGCALRCGCGRRAGVVGLADAHGGRRRVGYRATPGWGGPCTWAARSAAWSCRSRGSPVAEPAA
jgi:hypothetical protein